MTRARWSGATVVLSLLLTTVVSVALPVASNAAAADAASPVRIMKVQYNSPGSDTGSNASLNAEYVIIKNTSTTTRSLTGWTLRDKANHVFTFGTFALGAGKSVVVRTGKGSPSAANQYFQSKAYVWNNTGDTAYLRNAAGSQMSACTWGGTGSSKNC